MKRILIVLVALVAMVAFVGGAVAQEKKAPAPAPAAPAAEKAKADKPKAPKAMNFKGTVVAYEAGKTIKVKGAKEKEMTFNIAADAKIKGEAKEGAKVTVGYKKDGDKMVATSIAVAAPKKAKKEMKEEKKK
jgi:Na+-transporting methylmalonyl-CoA/oxaloacetate decarboxylase gamma subunit